jgi:hypothetical protein
MDNLGAHRPKRIRELIEQRGCGLLYLPAYSFGLQPYRRGICQDQEPAAQSCSQDQGDFLGAIGAALIAITAENAHGFEHAGYHPTAHLL